MRKLLCKLGLHDYRSIPDSVRRLAEKGGLKGPPDWYAGRHSGFSKCWYCGKIR